VYVVGYVLITFVAGLQVQPVQLQRFRTQAECLTAADEARAFVTTGGQQIALVCVPQVKEPKK
jgi:hypothetical protein